MVEFARPVIVISDVNEEDKLFLLTYSHEMAYMKIKPDVVSTELPVPTTQHLVSQQVYPYRANTCTYTTLYTYNTPASTI